MVGQVVTAIRNQTLACLNQAIAAAFGKADLGIYVGYASVLVNNTEELVFEYADKHADDRIELPILSLPALTKEHVTGEEGGNTE